MTIKPSAPAPVSTPSWLWVQRDYRYGESLDVYLSDEERQDIERQPSFRGWSEGELTEVQP